MAVKLRRPILIGGIGLSFALWLFESLNHSLEELGEWTLFGAIALGGAAWWWKMRSPQSQPSLAVTSVDRATAENAIAQAKEAFKQLESEIQTAAKPVPEVTQRLQPLQQRLGQLDEELARTQLRIAVAGGKATGKTALVQVLSSWWHEDRDLAITETPALFVEEDTEDILQSALGCDLTLFVTTGDLTEPELNAVGTLRSSPQQVVVAWNKQDQCTEEDRPGVLVQLQQRLDGWLDAQDIIAIAASPAPVKVRQHQSDGSVREWLEPPAAEIAPLRDRLESIVTGDRQSLVFATTFRQAKQVQADIKDSLDQLRRDRALPIIEQCQWVAAASAFANPVPALDLLATGAINAQLVLDLGKVYQQKLSMQQAQTVAGTLGSLMLKLGLVELSTQAITTVLKHNPVTFVAGGAAEGISAAYLTRLAGLSLIEYFQEQEIAIAEDGTLLNGDRLKQKLQAVFQRNQRTAFLQAFVKQVGGYLSAKSASAKPAGGETVAS